MAERNRITPYGEIVAAPLRGAWMGNRGSLHRGHDIVRPWSTRRWITCVLEYKGWVAPKWLPGRWTPLYFYDEALALAAGHRPCALCRRADYEQYRDSVQMAGADAMDWQLHIERLDGRSKRKHALSWAALPNGTYVEVEDVPHVVLSDSIRPWTLQHGYGSERVRPKHGSALVLTPPQSIRAIAAGYKAQIAR
ncbi:MAG: hypothetical protein M3N19_06025 [Candidatus Eremiobacteraeota bacterium]|nr:hypothetical protein [Candidatus Eremiobacteraeota bacterium]